MLLTTPISIETFLDVFNVEDEQTGEPRVKSANLIREMSLKRLAELGCAQVIPLNSIQQFDAIEKANLTWDEEVGWFDAESANLTLLDALNFFKHDSSYRNLDQNLEGLRAGHNQDIEIISVYDSMLEQRLIVSGMHDLVALFYLYYEDLESFSKLILNTKYKITIFEFVTAVGWFVFPADFMPLYFKKKQEDDLTDSVATFFDIFLEYKKRQGNV